MAYDLVLSGGTIVDGTGQPRFTADIAIADGRIVEIGRVAGGAARRIDISGLVAAPGIVDIHTHYDAQLCWDSVLSSSAEHGTTTVVTGNCGIGVAPCRPEDRELVLRNLVALEGIPFDVMQAGIDWRFESFPDYVEGLRRRGTGINVAPLVPLGLLRRFVQGDAASERAASPAERDRIAALLRDAMDAGAIGFSTGMVRRQVGHEGRPLPSQFADAAELTAYAHVLRGLRRGIVQINILERPAFMSDSEFAIIDLLLRESGRPVTYSGALYRDDAPDAIEAMLQQVEPLRRRGARPQTTVRPLTMEVDLRRPFPFADVTPFKRILNQPLEAQRALYADPAWRAEARAEIENGGKLFGAAYADSVVLRAKTERMQRLLHRTVRDIAEERGACPFDTMLDLALEDDLETVFLGAVFNTRPEQLKRHIKDPRLLIGLGDGGAHLDMLCESGYPTYMLGHWVRAEGAISLEEAIRRMTSEPAEYFGLAGRGRLAPAAAADLMIFDPATVGSPARADEIRQDLPGGGTRLYARASGVAYVIVNGTPLFEHGAHTGGLPGRIIGCR